MAEGEDPRIVAEFSDYNELITALRLRAAELNLSGEQCDLLSGLPARYSQKLLGPNQIRRLGAISLGPFLGALAVRGLLVEDSVALEKLRRQTTPSRNEYVRSAATYVTRAEILWWQSVALAQLRGSTTRPRRNDVNGPGLQ